MLFWNLIIFVLVFIVVVRQDGSLAADDVKGGRPNLTQVQEECFKILEFTEDQKKQIISKSVFEKDKKSATHPMQCYSHCYYYQLGIIDAKNKINEKLVATYLNQIFDDDEKHVKYILKTCKLEKAKADRRDICEIAYFHALCIHEHVHDVDEE